ncbi:ribonuclease H-like domain-containing protein [Tanacetum coccineum]
MRGSTSESKHEVIENGKSWVPKLPYTAPESSPSTALKMTVPSTAEEKICKKNDVKARRVSTRQHQEMDLKWNMALLSMRARKFYQRTGRKIIIDGSSTAGYDKSKVECFNCYKMGHFAREYRAPRSKDNRNWNQRSSSKAVRIEDASGENVNECYRCARI